MPKIAELLQAEAAHADVNKALASCYAERERLKAELATLNDAIALTLAPTSQALEAARDKQARTLTAWIMSGKESGTRYRLKQHGLEDRCWDSRVWLRRMGTPVTRSDKKWPYDYDTVYHWTVSYRSPDDKKSFEERINLPLETPFEIVAIEADKLVLQAGWFLTNELNKL